MQDPTGTPPVVKPILGPPQQIKDGPPIRLPNLPDMENRGGVKTILRNPNLPDMTLARPPIPGPGQNLMGKWDGPPTSHPPVEGGPHPPQQAIPEPPGPPVAESYVRIEMHSENGVLSVVGVHSVPGPLILPATVTRGYVYEAIIGDQQVALGSLPDVGLSRSFANIDVPGPEGKHRIFLKPSFNFFIRVPASHMTVNTLPQLHVLLHNVTDAPDRLEPNVPLQRQPGVKATQVGVLPGIKLEALPEQLRPELEKLIRR